MGSQSMNLIHRQIDILLIGYFLTAYHLGIYTVAVSLSRFFWRIPQSVQTVTFPTSSEYWSKGKHSSLNKMIDKSMKYSACILILIGLVVWFFTEDIIVFLFGGDFITATLPLQVLLIGTIINGATNRPIGGSLAAAGYPELGFYITSMSAGLNIGLNLILIPLYGILGAAIATAVTLTIASLLSLFFVRKKLRVELDIKWFVKAFGAAVLLILVFYTMEWINKYLIGFAILCIYLIFILKFLLQSDDREMLKSIIYSIFRKFMKR